MATPRHIIRVELTRALPLYSYLEFEAKRSPLPPLGSRLLRAPRVCYAGYAMVEPRVALLSSAKWRGRDFKTVIRESAEIAL